MERQFFINWPAIVEEARLRRKSQRLTQARLAEMAGVSTPTISHFEKGKKDIYLSTVIRVLTVLGMNDERSLNFPQPNEHYDFDRSVVVFTGQDADKVIRIAISQEALEDFFAGNGKDLLKVFQMNRERIEHEARRKYLVGSFETDGSILLKTTDLEL